MKITKILSNEISGLIVCLALCVTVWNHQDMQIRHCDGKYLYQRLQGAIVTYEEEISYERFQFLKGYYERDRSERNQDND